MKTPSRSKLHAPSRSHPRLRPLTLSLAVAVACMAHGAAAGAAALPSGMQVLAGHAAATRSGATLDIRTGQRTILDWRRFSIGAGNAVVFEQPGASSAVLNRVIGGDPSAILGELRSNGQVWLINPHGVLFGSGARVDVAALVASTLEIDNRAFLAGAGMLAAPPGGAAAVVNEGSIRTPYGGHVLLVGSSVRNEGSIEVPGGRAALLAARNVELADSNTPFMRFKVPSLAGLAAQQGSVAAGEIDIYGAVVNQQGTAVASSLGRDAAGRIVLRSRGDMVLGAGSVTRAQGGSVRISSSRADVLVDAAVDASAASGNGGSIAVRARSIAIGAGASLRADAAGAGHGGRITLRARDSTTVLGALSARGGSIAGSGGRIETSAGDLLNVQRAPDASAGHGQAGSWLVDPYDITIVAGSGASAISGSNPFDASASGAQLGARLIDSALAAGTSVVVSTGGSGSGAQAGDITVASPISASLPPGGATLTLDAWNNIQVDSAISAIAGGGPLALTLDAGQGASGGQVNLPAGASIRLNGGTLSLGSRALLSGATLQNLTVTGTAGLSATAGTSVLDNVVLQDPLSIAAGASVDVPNTLGLAFDGLLGVTLQGSSGATAALDFTGSGTLAAITGNGAVILAGTSDVVQPVSVGSTLSVGPGIEVASTSPGSNVLGNSSLGLLNQGAVGADGRAGVAAALTVTGSGWVNQGTIGPGSNTFLGSNGAVTLQGSWSNPAGGTLYVGADGTLVLDGAFSTSSLGTVSNPYLSGRFVLGPQGVWNNSGQSYSLAAMGGLQLQGGQILGGALAGAGYPIEASAGNSTLDRVELGANLQIDPGAAVTALNTLTIDPGISVDMNNPSETGTGPLLSLQGTAPLLTGGGVVNLNDNSVLALGPNATIASGMTVTTTSSGTLSGVATIQASNGFDNQGTISSASACPSGCAFTPDSEELEIAGSGVSWSNSGDIQALGGIVDLQGNWSNASGTLDNEGGVFLLDGNFDTAGLGNLLGAGTYALASHGVWNNQSQTYNIDAMGGLVLAGGSLLGGTLTSAAGNAVAAAPSALTLLQANGTLAAGTIAEWGPQSTLDGVTLDAATFIDPGAGIVVPGGLSLTSRGDISMGGYGGPYAYGAGTALLDFSGAGLAPQLLGTGTVDLLGAAVVQASAAASTLTIGSGATVRADTAGGNGLGGAGAKLLNQGTLLASASGSLQLLGTSLQNQGRIVVDAGGSIATGGSDLLNAAGATVRGDGTIDLRSAGGAAGTLINDGTIDPGIAAGATGSLSLDGNLSQSASGTLHVDLGGPSPGSGYDVLETTGSAAVGGTLDVAATSGYTAAATDSFAYLRFGSSSGAFSQVVFHAPAASWGLTNLRQATAWVLQQPPAAGGSGGTGGTGGTGGSTGSTGSTGSSGSSGSSGTHGTGGSGVPGGVGANARAPLGPSAAATVLQSVLDFAQGASSNSGPGASPTSAARSFAAAGKLLSGAPRGGLTGASSAIVNSVPSETPAWSGSSGKAAPAGSRPLGAAAMFHTVPRYLYLDSDLSNLYFRVLPLTQMGRGEIGKVLSARNAYMRQLFAAANKQLAANPDLANLPDCTPAQNPAAGNCLFVPPRHPPRDDRPRFARAVVIGLDSYTDPRIPRLIGAVPDAHAIGKLLHSEMGYRVQLLRDPSKRELIGALNTLIEHAGPNDSILIYYAGHGDTVDSTGEGYWIPSDADPDSPRGWVSNVDIDRLLQRARSRQIAVVSDSCYSGQFVQNRKVMDLRRVPPLSALLRRRAVTVMSSGGDEPVADTGDDGHSVFASDFMRSLRSIRGWSNGDRVFHQVRTGVESVLPQSPRYGAVLSAGHQPGADYVFERGAQGAPD